MEKEQVIEKIKNILQSYYRVTPENWDNGCYCNGRWLSVADVIEVIDNNLDM